MPNVEILTIHFGINHGSVLQCYALCKTLEACGAVVEVIDYVPRRYRMWDNVSLKYPNKSLAWKVLYFLASSVIRGPQKAVFRLYLKDLLNLSKRYRTLDELIAEPPQGDVYLVGSDQVWNSHYNGDANPAYFLPFAPQGAMLFSYAASIGSDEISPSEQMGFRNGLARFNAVSVRERQAVKTLGLLGIHAREDLDPVFLLDTNEWFELASNKGLGKNYVLVYVIAQNYENMISQARNIAADMGYELYVLSVRPIRRAGIDKNYIFTNPSDFLALFINAAFIVSNSFHGTAFSIILNKPFLTFSTKYNSRIESILQITGLKNRLVTDHYNDDQIKTAPDFTSANVAIGDAAKRSRTYLKAIVERAAHDC